jgi:HflK protein
MTVIANLFNSIWSIFQDASLYLLFGYGLATVLHIYLDPQKLVAMLGRNRFGAIIKATLYGIPLPLCSCAVIPSAITLKKKGVSDGATIAYLIATPESGLDSIVVTYGLMGFAFTVFRIISAFFIAITTGSVIELVEAWPSDAPDETGNANNSNSCRTYKTDENKIKTLRGWVESFVGNFHDLFDETAACGFFEQEIFSGIFSYLLMLLIGLPMYICASASTPIAAMLIFKGLSPGAALVFLIAGPATNLGSLVLLIRTFGKRVIYSYLVTLSVLTLSTGFIIDSLQSVFPVNLPDTLTQTGLGQRSIFETICAVVFIALVAHSFYRTDSYRKTGEYIGDLLGIEFTRKKLIAGLSCLLLLGYLSSGILIVQADQTAVIERFGKPHTAEYGPGIYLHYPYPIEIGKTINPHRTRSLNLGFKIKPDSIGNMGTRDSRLIKVEKESNYLTGDENIIDIESIIQYKVSNTKEFLYNSVDPDKVLKELARTVLTKEIATYPIDEIYTLRRHDIEQSVVESMQTYADLLKLGIDVLSFNFLYVHAPIALHYAFRDVASAMEDKETTIYRALEYAHQTDNLAKAGAYKAVSEAEADQETAIAKAGGESRRFRLQQAQYKKNPGAFRLRLYLEKVERVLSDRVKFISPQGGDGLDLWLAPPRTNRDSMFYPLNISEDSKLKKEKK